MNPPSKLTLIVRNAHVHKQKHTRNSVSESTYACRMTRVRQTFWAKMATLDLNQSIWRTLWGSGRGITAQTAPEQLPQQQQVEQLAGVAWLQ